MYKLFAQRIFFYGQLHFSLTLSPKGFSLLDRTGEMLIPFRSQGKTGEVHYRLASPGDGWTYYHLLIDQDLKPECPSFYG